MGDGLKSEFRVGKFEDDKDYIKMHKEMFLGKATEFSKNVAQLCAEMEKVDTSKLSEDELITYVYKSDLLHAINICNNIMSEFAHNKVKDQNKGIKLDKPIYEYFMDAIVKINNAYCEKVEEFEKNRSQN